ncbi:helix-turn-helix domain-containing protein [Bacillus thuringiensis]|uniref:helix-turn-helix domain-containing protein n=1 Tax=Bacillus thuringiensis TaxID=1428 RepID=UPI0026E1FDAB|nr:helix-turn-helix transcriptional regulator [Bacillus thuringiensis]MDO6663559.1 helix-turn-helix transcriptional regulator [Bacillus thuringiensis]MDO6704268.1 helix-turn-helix transcriptional regulator [Bacillus thuringiensis]
MLKITLRAARVNAGYKLVEAAEKFGINKDTLSKYEKDSSNIPRRFFIKIEEVYKIPVENIFFGNQSDFFRKNKIA